MPTTLYLIRHAAYRLIGHAFAGRMLGVGLSEEGRRQSERLAARLAGTPLRAIYASPLERAQKTAAPLAARCGIAIRTVPALDEFDVGGWTGRGFDDLRGDALWESFNRFRSSTRPPGGGETMLEVQVRIVGFFDELRRRHPEQRVAVVSHADVLKAALLHYLGMPLDLFMRIEVAPASISILELADSGPRLLLLNETIATDADG